MKRFAFLGLFIPALLGAQPKGVWLEWRNAGLTLYPDSAGVFVYTQTHGLPGRQAYFSGSFDPARLNEWLAVARGFNSQTIDPNDTSELRSSPMLQSVIGDAIHVYRRRDQGVWTEERFLVFESIRGTPPVVIPGTERTMVQILDSLGAVAKRTNFSSTAAQQVITETVMVSYDREAAASPDNKPPAYPSGSGRQRRNGLVVLSFFVDADGRSEMGTVRQLFTSAPPFYDAVMEALPAMKFFPAELKGKKVRSKVVMPFAFSVVR